ncbi:MAG: 23S rRNA (pseudouridine(1915)-N(3))-methyltransferase RlmH [Bacteroidales bacterium]|nr:23S rRNA (pseudouridine(1915)-N(3))-methyltransferase RlmH [Bacteroidales bacterium]
MRFTLFNIDKTEPCYLSEGINEFRDRIKNFIDFDIIDLPGIKNTGKFPVKLYIQKESEIIKKAVAKYDFIVLLDEKGTNFDSRGFANWFGKIINQGKKRVAFITGGAYGFSEDLIEMCDYRISLSKLTFTHQMVRLIFVEQLYRACTILKGMSYHND